MVSVPSALSSIKYEQMTHLIFHEVGVTSTTDPTLWSGWGIADTKSRLAQCVTAGHNKGIKVLLSLMSTDGTHSIVNIANTPTLRASYVQQVKDLCVAYNVDGVVTDYEEIAAYPVDQAHPGPYDIMTDALYAALNPLGKIIGNAGAWDRLNFVLATQSKLDFVAVMCYDMSYPPATATPPVHATYTDSVAAMNLWVNAGWSKDKLLLGIPVYGKDKNYNVVLYSELIDALNPPPSQELSNVTSVSTPRGVIPVVGGLWWNSIDNTKQKADFVNTNVFGGMMLFDVGEDKFNDPRSLLDVVYNKLSTGGTTVMVTFNALLKEAVSGSFVAGKTITFVVTGPTNETFTAMTNVSGLASVQKTYAAGTYSVTASVPADVTYNGVTSTPVSFNVSKLNLTLTLTVV